MLGGIQQREATVGLLGFQFQAPPPQIKPFGSGKYAQPTYEVEGELVWFLAKPLADPNHELILKKLVGKLMQFAMVLGGFGKSWRRVDHRKFFEEYYEGKYKALIGCHWQWLGENTQSRNVQVSRLEKVGEFLDNVRQIAREWIQSQNKPLREAEWATDWREAWHPSNVQVWGRIAENADESAAVHWFHKSYQQRIQNVQLEGSIYKSSVTGEIGQISLIWHRMYPLIILNKDPKNPRKPIIKTTPRYLEIITIFPNESTKSNDFLNFLNTHPEQFEQLLGDKK